MARGPKPRPEGDLFWGKVRLPDENGCLIWTAWSNNKGYGTFSRGGKTRYAHRVAYEMLVGPIPEGLELDHLCRVPLCVRPDHLEPVTHAENVRRGNAGKATGALMKAKTHCKHGHEFTPENTLLASTGARACRACRRIREANRRERNNHGIQGLHRG